MKMCISTLLLCIHVCWKNTKCYAVQSCQSLKTRIHMPAHATRKSVLPQISIWITERCCGQHLHLLHSVHSISAETYHQLYINGINLDSSPCSPLLRLTSISANIWIFYGDFQTFLISDHYDWNIRTWQFFPWFVRFEVKFLDSSTIAYTFYWCHQLQLPTFKLPWNRRHTSCILYGPHKMNHTGAHSNNPQLRPI